MNDSHTLTIETAGLEAKISTSGAYLESLTWQGKNLLFPKTKVGESTRGGSFVCTPFFGPAPAGSPIKQHGFGRSMEWQALDEQTRSGPVLLVLDILDSTGEDGLAAYVGLHSELTYYISVTEDGDPQLKMMYSAKNYSDQPMQVLPAFHPYLQLAADEQASFVVVNGEAYDTLNPALHQPRQNPSTKIEAKDYVLTLVTNNLEHRTLWSDTDEPGKYICVEPTAAGQIIDVSDPELGLLAPGMGQEFTATLTWHLK
jgi:galactose mutarotase-like enzyme